MNAARLYETPNEFAEMMKHRLEEELKVKLRQDSREPLLLFGMEDKDGKEEDIFRISLHNTYQTYMATGDLNTAIDYLNGVIQAARYTRHSEEEMMRLDLSQVYPVLRDKGYMKDELAQDAVSEEVLPGLMMMYMELNGGFSKIIGASIMDRHPRLTEERLKRIASRNLRSEGWTLPKLSLPSPKRKSCIVDVYLDNPLPIECQFLNKDLAEGRMPESYLIAFTNRDTTLVMHSEEEMQSIDQARNLARQSRFTDVVNRSFLAMPSPNTRHIYWSHRGEFTLLDI